MPTAAPGGLFARHNPERSAYAVLGEAAGFVDTAGDGFLATFDGPARAIRCACAIRDAARDLAIVRTIREAVGPEAEIVVDVEILEVDRSRTKTLACRRKRRSS